MAIFGTAVPWHWQPLQDWAMCYVLHLILEALDPEPPTSLDGLYHWIKRQEINESLETGGKSQMLPILDCLDLQQV